MRVIAGSARSIQLKTLDGLDTRPTTDRIKETLFNMLAPDLLDCNFLDLFAGSGGIGIEALSRGAAEAAFVENNPRAFAYICENLEKTRLAEKAVTMKSDVMVALGRLDGRKKFDIIFMDPPYGKLLEKKVLAYLSDSDLLEEDGTIIVEAALETPFDYLQEMGFELIKEKKYKTNKHVFIKVSEREEIC